MQNENFYIRILTEINEVNRDNYAKLGSLSKKLNGLDSLLSISQMPKGIPVGTVTIGKDGAINAALLSASIISINDKNVRRNLNLWRNKQTRSVKKKPS